MMGVAFVAERKLLADDEYEPVVRSHYPALGELPQDELIDLARWLRSQKSKAKDIVQHRRRVRRGKAAPRNAAAETASERGLTVKKQVFSRALKRVNARLGQVRDQERHAQIRAALDAALERKRNAPVHRPSGGRTARAGMRPIQSRKGIRIIDPSSIGRVSQSVRDAQARRDTR
jgi:hypothetical protein